MSENWTALLYLVAAVCFIIALKGLSSPKTARLGNVIGAAGALVAVLVVFAHERPDRLVFLLLAIAVGGAIGTVAARRVAMTAMPQMVALFNGVGGAAGALVALLELAEGTGGAVAHLAVIAFTVLIGSITFSGSVLTFAKLQELVTGRPMLFPGMRWVAVAAVAGSLATGVWVALDGSVAGAGLLAVLTLGLGLLLVLPVGGADVPIVISLLNAFSGITVLSSQALVLAFGVVLLVSVSLSGVAARTVLSTALLFLLAGALIGQGGFGLVDIPSSGPFVTTLADLALFTVLFTDGQRAGLPALREGWRLSGRALGFAMPLTMVGIAVPAHFFAGLDWPTGRSGCGGCSIWSPGSTTGSRCRSC